MKKKYVALLSLAIASLAVTATISVGHSVWRYSLDDRTAAPTEHVFEIHFKTYAGGALDSLNYTGLEYNSYLELPHRTRDSHTFLGWSLTQNGSPTYVVDYIWQYSTIYNAKYSAGERYTYNYVDLYEIYS